MNNDTIKCGITSHLFTNKDEKMKKDKIRTT